MEAMMTAKTETRSIALPVSHRADGNKNTVAGYAATFGETADIGGYFREIIAPGAFSQSLTTADVRAYYGHDRQRLLGRSSAGTLRLKEDAKGLAVEIDLPDTTDGRDVGELIARGDITGMSFGFIVTHDEWDMTGTVDTRTIHQVELLEVSVVSEPAYEGTSIALRSRDEARKEKRQQNFNAAGLRLRMKAHLDLRVRSKA
jgi:HK97 family phage prohead protease